VATPLAGRGALRALRDREFARLDRDGHVYLDHTGAALYPASLVAAHAGRLCSTVAGNPHSRSPASARSTRAIDAARARVLEFFSADPAEYAVAFTPNATGALKLVAEGYHFEARSRLRLAADNHNSVNGIRAYAARRGADVRYLGLDGELRLRAVAADLRGADPRVANLFAFPAQSNFSGVKHDLGLVAAAHDHGYDVLLDAAAFAPTSRLRLDRTSPEFVAVSFYKMFGFPTGVGALIVKHRALRALRRVWFGGGTVRFASVQHAAHIPHATAAGLEDGTPNFLDVAAVPDGLDFLDAVGLERIAAHVAGLTAYMLGELAALRHDGGAPAVRVYGPPGAAGRGGTVAFNVLDPRGGVVDCRLVEAAAAAQNVSLRTGVFCNPGAAEAALALPADETRACLEAIGRAGEDTFTLQRLSECLGGRPVGAVRASVGMSSTRADVRALARVLRGVLAEAAADDAPAGRQQNAA
jgi:selenocysteine lyase/cysteine desulfurase